MGEAVREHDPMYLALGMFLRGTRLSQGGSQVAVADRLGIKASQVSGYERGRTRIPMLTFCRWCRLLDLDPGATLNRVYETMSRRTL